jgi:phosphoglycerate kinase
LALLHEPDLLDTARRIAARVDIPLPVDVVTGKEISASATATVRAPKDVGADEMILDIGPETARRLAERIRGAGTVLWNGPVGVFEHDQFGEGTRVLAGDCAKCRVLDRGGGDTLAAIDKYGVADGISYISTGGGAFLEFVEANSSRRGDTKSAQSRVVADAAFVPVRRASFRWRFSNAGAAARPRLRNCGAAPMR